MARILVVDDDNAILSMVCSILARIGHTVLTASNGKECLAQLESGRPDLVLTDLFMPDMDGMETIAAVQDRWPGVKIMAMSGGGANPSSVDFLDLAGHLGADQTIRKPFNFKQLIEAVNQVLEI
jgi:two-component system chemotaxis response regulator CheY